MPNGDARMQPAGGGDGLPGMEPAVIQVNFGLKARHIIVAFSTMMAGIGALGTAGWLVLPAKQSDLTRVEQSLDGIRTDVKNMQSVTEKLTVAVQGLQSAVEDVRKLPKRADSAARVPRPPPKPAAKPLGGLFGF